MNSESQAVAAGSCRWPEEADFQPWRSHSIGSHKLHDQHMHAQVHWLRAADAGRLQARQVSELLLSPQLDHLARVGLAVACAEAEVSLHIPAPKHFSCEQSVPCCRKT